MPVNVKHALGGIGILASIIVAILFIFCPAIRLIGATWIGGIGVLLAGFYFSLCGIFAPPYEYADFVRPIAAIGVGILVAFTTALWLRPDFLLLVMPVAPWVGGIAVVALILVPSIFAILAKNKPK